MTAAAGETRSARKRQAIVAAATELFLEHGYPGTSMDDIAARAAVSKQTVYKHFADKERLFTDIVLGTLDRAGDPFRARIEKLADTTDLAAGLRDLAREYAGTVMQAPVLQLRRLVISEAARLPGLAQAYYERAPERTVKALAACFERLAGRGLLRVADPMLAASQFAFLVLGAPLDRSLFCGLDGVTRQELTRVADAGAAAFLRAYQPDA